MKERVKLKGVVSARNAKTGEVIFENLQNTIVLGGCISALAKIAGIESTPDNEIFIEQSPAPLNWSSNLNKPITGYNFVYSPGTNLPSVDPVDKLYDESEAASESRVFVAPAPVGFFDGSEPYKVADIPDGAKDSHIITLNDGCLSFIRYKLTLKNSIPEGSDPDPTVIQNHGDGGITYVSSIELFCSGEGMDKPMLFSKLNFPAIPFFGSLAIDFEYRIYL